MIAGGVVAVALLLTPGASLACGIAIGLQAGSDE